MSSKIQKFVQAPSMTSLEISEMLGNRHDKTKQSIERLAEQGVIELPPLGDVQNKGGNNRKYTTSLYTFTGDKGKRDCLVVVAQLSPAFTANIVDRWIYLETRYQNEVKRIEARKDSTDLFRAMSSSVKQIRESDGKEVKAYHYTNEANLINRIIFDAPAKKIRDDRGISKDDPVRDFFSKLELAAVNDLQQANITLFEMGMSYEDRKENLTKLFNRKHKDKLVNALVRKPFLS